MKAYCDEYGIVCIVDLRPILEFLIPIFILSSIFFILLYGFTQTIRYLRYGLKPWEHPYECLECVLDFNTLEELNKHECKEEDLLENSHN